MVARRRLLLAGGALALALAVLTLGRWDLRLTSPCKLEAAARASVRTRAEGRVAELTTHEGAHVRRGQIVGYLATFERQQRRTELEAELRTMHLEMDALQDRLFINDGKGNFRRDEAALPRFSESGSCVVPGDFNGDGHLDLFVGRRVVARNYGATPRSNRAAAGSTTAHAAV